MSTHKTPQSQKLIKLIESAPFKKKEIEKWSSTLHEEGITAELADEIHEAFSKLSPEKFDGEWQKAKFSMDFTALINQWRMSEASKNFKHNR